MAHNRINCFICDVAAIPRTMSRLIGDANEPKRLIAVRFRNNLRREHAEFNENSRVCIACLAILNQEIRLQNDPSCTRLNILRVVRNNACFICHNNVGMQRLSQKCKVDIFVRMNIYVPDYARCCPQHIDNEGYIFQRLMPGLQYFNRLCRLVGQELNELLQMLRVFARPDQLNFNNVSSIADDDFQLISPITKEQFDDMFTYCDDFPDGNQIRHISKKDLLLFLCKIRQGLSDYFLKVIFNYSSRQSVSLTIRNVRTSLMLRFVPQNIGLNAITRDEYIQRHVTEFANALYNDEDVQKVIAFIDGTYSYVEKFSNFQALRQSYCVHKGRHLIKPALIVAPDGYILDIHGPYFSDSRNNDAAMLRKEFEDNAAGLRQWLGENAIFVVDRGYRDVLPLLEHLGIETHMPAFLERGQRQLTTEDANDSRLITKCRWIIEARNGHVKSIFKFFNNVIPFHHATNLRDFYLIAGAILNKYREPILMQGATADLARVMLERARAPNHLQIRVEAENLARRNAIWSRLNHNHILDFPPLTLDYLRDLTIGIYQIKLSSSYIQDKMLRDQSEILEVDEHRVEVGLLRIRIYSRFRNATRYELWIQYNPANNENQENDNEPILGYYCTCKTGARTLGTCAHIASTLWFLGYARHQPNIKYPSTAILENIADVGERHHPD